jgi:hypothetical protein
MLFGLEIHDVRQVDLQHLGAGEDPGRIPGDGREGIGHLMQFRCRSLYDLDFGVHHFHIDFTGHSFPLFLNGVSQVL